MFDNIFNALGLKEEEAKIYLLLLETGPLTAGVIAKKIGKPRSSVYEFLKRLQEKEVIIVSFIDDIHTYMPQPPEKISQILQQKIEDLQNKQKLYKNLLPQLDKIVPSKFLSPKFQIHEGEAGLEQVMRDMLLYSNIETQAYWPIKSMVEILSQDFFRYHNKERIKNNIYTRAIWPVSQAVDIKKFPFLGVGEEFKREIRVAPPEIDFSMGYWIYRDKVIFISSRKESFGFVIESRELAEMQRSQFEIIWKISKSLQVNPEDTAGFLKEVYTF